MSTSITIGKIRINGIGLSESQAEDLLAHITSSLQLDNHVSQQNRDVTIDQESPDLKKLGRTVAREVRLCVSRRGGNDG